MTQPSVAHYFNCRKRPLFNDYELSRTVKLTKKVHEQATDALETKPIANSDQEQVIEQTEDVVMRDNAVKDSKPLEAAVVLDQEVPKTSQHHSVTLIDTDLGARCVTPEPNDITDKEGIDECNRLKKVICQHKRYPDLKKSLDKLRRSSQTLKILEKRSNELLESPKLKTFNSIELEVIVSPQKIHSPEKLYLSPKKNSSVKKNLFGTWSPIKKDPSVSDIKFSNDLSSDETKFNLQLPFKYRTLSEIFRAIDTVAQIMFNRQEIITFKKLKPAVEKLVKRTLQKRHLAQIKFIYPNAYDFTEQRVKNFGMKLREEKDLVLTPIVAAAIMNAQDLLDRRRKFHTILIDRVKNYHSEFLSSLTPPIIIPKDDVTRWHAEFNVEKVPDIEMAPLPETLTTEERTSEKQVLEATRRLFACNNERMNQALSNLHEASKKQSCPQQKPANEVTTLMKGIPKAILEKVRQKQASKALIAITTSVEKEKELQVYGRLPELARLIRNLFVTEKKSILPLDLVLEKLHHSCHGSLSKNEMEYHLKVISTKLRGWLVFHNLRSSVFLKLDKNADLMVILKKLQKLKEGT